MSQRTRDTETPMLPKQERRAHARRERDRIHVELQSVAQECRRVWRPRTCTSPAAPGSPPSHHDAEVAKSKLAKRNRAKRHWKTKMWKRRTQLREAKVEMLQMTGNHGGHHRPTEHGGRTDVPNPRTDGNMSDRVAGLRFAGARVRRGHGGFGVGQRALARRTVARRPPNGTRRPGAVWSFLVNPDLHRQTPNTASHSRRRRSGVLLQVVQLEHAILGVVLVDEGPFGAPHLGSGRRGQKRRGPAQTLGCERAPSSNGRPTRSSRSSSLRSGPERFEHRRVEAPGDPGRTTSADSLGGVPSLVGEEQPGDLVLVLVGHQLDGARTGRRSRRTPDRRTPRPVRRGRGTDRRSLVLIRRPDPQRAARRPQCGAEGGRASTRRWSDGGSTGTSTGAASGTQRASAGRDCIGGGHDGPPPCDRRQVGLDRHTVEADRLARPASIEIGSAPDSSAAPATTMLAVVRRPHEHGRR